MVGFVLTYSAFMFGKIHATRCPPQPTKAPFLIYTQNIRNRAKSLKTKHKRISNLYKTRAFQIIVVIVARLSLPAPKLAENPFLIFRLKIRNLANLLKIKHKAFSNLYGVPALLFNLTLDFAASGAALPC